MPAALQDNVPAKYTSATGSEPDLDELNEKYKKLTPVERIQEIYKDFDKVLLTSSFGTTAVYQLFLFHQAGIKQPVHFIDTTYHFQETLDYKEKLTNLFDLNVISITPDIDQNEYSRIGELWRYDPDQCCHINKVEPFEKIRDKYEVWISGLMSWQSSHRENLNIFEVKKGVIKFYPILDVSEEEALGVIEKNNLPMHPLKPLGYESIGCKHCTLKGKKRKGRWAQTVKTECGLHL
ncbi:MAG: phosphoadenylyl-sulfate reductase [Cyclobacteriaceae bacterium]|nr:phosphoadenylyl-sulfate reductase [Cyclobacteriaceae bacterium]